MGYFSNGTEGADYEEKYCNHCVHQLEDYGCPCWNAHYFWNIVLVLTMFFCLPDTIYSLVNPEYWALKKILTAIKPS